MWFRGGLEQVGDLITITDDDYPLGKHPVSLNGSGIVALADLRLAIGASASTAKVGANLTYTITATNGGPTPAAGVTITDVLPTNTTFVSASGSGFVCAAPPVGSTGMVSCTSAAALTSGLSTVLKITVKVGNGSKTSMTNTATVSSPTPDPSSANNTASITTSIYGKR